MWKVTYQTNEFGWRLTSEPDRKEKPERYLLFFGEAYTFGNDVEDDETLPSCVAIKRPDLQVYNFGGIGYGPQQMLALAESGELKEQVKEPRGIGVFVFITGHFTRAFYEMRPVAGWASHFPYYDLDPIEGIQRAGNYDEVFPG